MELLGGFGDSESAYVPGTVDAKVLGGIYFGLVALATIQLIRVMLSKTRRIWSLQSAFLALCLAWTLCRGIYFTIVFEDSESCKGYVCSGGDNDLATCNPQNHTKLSPNECPGGKCVSKSTLTCEGQHILFGLPTIIQTLMLAILIFFYALWVHKANGYIYRRRVLLVCLIINGIYYVCFFLWVLFIRCGPQADEWLECEWCRSAMNTVTGCTLFLLSGLMSYLSWKLYVHAQRMPPSTVQAPSGRRKIIWINMLIVVLFVSHGMLSLLGLSPDRQDVLPCPVLLFPHAVICILAEVLPALLLLLHFRRISRPTLHGSTAIDEPKPFARAEPSRPEEAYTDLTSSSSDSEEDTALSESDCATNEGGETALFQDVNRYEQSTHGIFQSSPQFRDTFREPLL